MSGEEHERLMDDPETLCGRTSPAATSLMYREIRTEGYAFLLKMAESAPISAVKEGFFHDFRLAGAAAAARRRICKSNPAQTALSRAWQTVRPIPAAAFPRSVLMSIRAIDGVTISTDMTQDDWINGYPPDTRDRQSQYRYQHNDGACPRIDPVLKMTMGRPERRLADLVDDAAGNLCVE